MNKLLIAILVPLAVSHTVFASDTKWADLPEERQVITKCPSADYFACQEAWSEAVSTSDPELKECFDYMGVVPVAGRTKTKVFLAVKESCVCKESMIKTQVQFKNINDTGSEYIHVKVCPPSKQSSRGSVSRTAGDRGNEHLGDTGGVD